jgi:predicted NACHT family NTPase
MASRSIAASQSAMAAIQNRLTTKKWGYEDFAEAAGVSRATVIGFCTGKKVDRKNFVTCCEKLDLDWEVISGQKTVATPVAEATTDIDSLVEQLRASSADSLRKRCGTMRILDMTQPIDSGAIYTDVNILERVAGKTSQKIQELVIHYGVEQFDRSLLGNVCQEHLDGLKAVLDRRLLMILGRPGAGKTMFLHHLVTECLTGNFLGDRLPIFVTLKEFAETEGQPGIVEFIASSIDRTALTQVLKLDRALVLLDGLDEVLEKDHDRVIREIREFAEKYDQNHIVITCRIAAREYIFQQFTEVQMADFNDDQIRSFANKWFKTKEKDAKSTTGELFWQELEQRKPVKELATNPLLLTLLCLEFDNSVTFPQSRSELYGRALNVLLAKWDGQRRIKRDDVYKGLSLKRKETLLGQLAMHTFERGDYFFKERVATEQIEQYIRNFPGASADLETLTLDSRAVLKSIESQHGLLAERARGIYSFSHLTFHEYFTAKNILDVSQPMVHEKALKRLLENMLEKRWQETFLLVVEQLDKADYFLILIKKKIDKLLAGDEKLQIYLQWVLKKSASVNVTYSNQSMRFFYFAYALDLYLLLDRTERSRDLNLDRVLALALDRSIGHTLAKNSTLERVIKNDVALVREKKMKLNLQRLYYRLPSRNNEIKFNEWWQKHGKKFTEELRAAMMKYRNIGHDWQFTDAQKTKLQEYYDANLLLANCLNSECYVSREVREEIEATMLLPMAEIEKWKAENGRN